MIDQPHHATALSLPKGEKGRPPLPLGEGWGEGAATTRARALRRTATPAERKLWQALRDRGVAGAKARRQVPCGPYVLDFVSTAHRLVIEIDGDTHALPERAAAEARRSAWLASYGLRILRFSNRDVLGNLNGVLTVIAEALHHPHPGPLPPGEDRGEEGPAPR